MVPPLEVQVSENRNQGLCCCTTFEDDAKVTFDNRTNDFQSTTVNVSCCIFGSKDKEKRRNLRTYQAIDKRLQQDYGVPLLTVLTALEMEFHEEEGFSGEMFGRIFQWASQKKLMEEAPASEEFAHSLRVIHEDGSKESFQIDRLRDQLKKLELHDQQVEKAANAIIHAISQTGSVEITPKQIRRLVETQVACIRSVQTIEGVDGVVTKIERIEGYGKTVERRGGGEGCIVEIVEE